MTLHADRSWLTVARNRLTGALCVLMLFAAVFPAYAGPSIVVQTDMVISSGQIFNGENPSDSAAPTGHVAAQCASGIGVLSDVAKPTVFVRMVFVQFGISDTSLLPSMALAPQFKPPRT